MIARGATRGLAAPDGQRPRGKVDAVVERPRRVVLVAPERAPVERWRGGDSARFVHRDAIARSAYIAR